MEDIKPFRKSVFFVHILVQMKYFVKKLLLTYEDFLFSRNPRKNFFISDQRFVNWFTTRKLQLLELSNRKIEILLVFHKALISHETCSQGCTVIFSFFLLTLMFRIT